MCNWFVVTCQTRGRARCPTAVTGNQTWLGKSLFIDDCPISTSLCLVPTGDVWTAFWGFFARSRLSSASTATSSSSRLLFIIYLRSSPWRKGSSAICSKVWMLCHIIWWKKQTHWVKELLVDVQQNLGYRLSPANVRRGKDMDPDMARTKKWSKLSKANNSIINHPDQSL